MEFPKKVPVRGANAWMSVDATMGDVLRAYGLMPGVSLARIQEVWPEVVGELNAKYSRVTSYANGKVFVAVEDSSRRHELSMRRVTMAERLAELLPGLKVTAIVFR